MLVLKRAYNINFTFVITLLLFISAITPAYADTLIMKEYGEPLIQVKPIETLLINGTSILLTTGQTWEFYQNYTLTIKSVNLEQRQVWIELLHENKTLKERILSEDEMFIYSKGEDEEERKILNLTVDTIYISPGGELVAFKPVYQYRDYDLPEPVIPEDEENIDQNNGSVSSGDNNVGQTSGFTIFQAFACTSILLACRRYYLK
ncbi:S-layer protein domain-containing protein [Methanolobus sp.]|jgi:hypothetical protein|uniref:S-layer protein domain-containing protein n=1 Tax=Methanolobus sp. TaxID=1874737 RepID=UPI0025CE68B2|nr:S-layer protein domain-containing protein [Methanolobus sp.]